MKGVAFLSKGGELSSCRSSHSPRCFLRAASCGRRRDHLPAGDAAGDADSSGVAIGNAKVAEGDADGVVDVPGDGDDVDVGDGDGEGDGVGVGVGVGVGGGGIMFSQ